MSDVQLLIYAPDKGVSYGQAPRARAARRVWDDVQRFLTSCAASLAAADVELTAYRATQWDDDATADACVERTRAAFGPPDQEEAAAGQLWPSGEPVKGGYLRWVGTPERAPAMLDFLVSGEPWPRQTLGPVELRATYQFRWNDAVLGGLLGVGHAARPVPDSSLALTVGRRSFIQPTLWFPYGADAASPDALLAALDPLLPFAMLAKHFRVAQPRGDGSGFRFAKLPRPPLGAT
jgi:hypothetical protein